MNRSALLVATLLVTRAAAAEPVGPAPADVTAVVASASSVQAGNDAWRACDGNDRTRWCADGAVFPQSLQIELDKPHAVGGIRIVWEQPGTSYAHTVETSTDGVTWTLAHDATGNQTKGVDEHSFAAVKARYVRLTCLGSSGGWASIREVTLKADGIKRIHPTLDETQKKAFDAEQAEALRAASDPYAKQGNAAPRAVRLTDEQERAILADVKVADGFDVTVFAAPPAVNYPVFVAAAPDGTLYVSSDGNGSVGRDPGRGRVIRLRDTDGDNRADEAKLFCEVDSPRGLVWDHDRLYLMHPPHLSAFIDKDGDGVAEEQKMLVKNLAFGFDKRSADHTTNGLGLGIDGWLYVAGGDFGFMEAEGTDGRKLTHRGGGVIRVRPDGTGLEIVSTGTRNILEVAISPTMELFARDNTNDGDGWNVRFHHFTGLDDHGYPRLYKNFDDECIPPLADYGGGSGCGATYIDEPGFGEWNDAPFTADWGAGALYRHGIRSKGATFEETEKPRPFIRMTRPTDADVDGMSRVYCASWKGATFKWEGADVGYIVCVTPRGFRAEPLPDFAKATEAELVALGSLESTAGHRRRLEAVRELNRRGVSEAGAAAAIEQRRPPERNLVERFRQIVVAKDMSRVGEIIAHIGAADPVVSHTAVRALAAMEAADAALAALDTTVAGDRWALLRSLAMMHRPDVVARLTSRLANATDTGLRKGLLAALCRLHYREGTWKGDSWGTRPDTRGPYYQPEPWGETPRIAAVLAAALQTSTPEEVAFLVQELRRNRISSDGAVDRMIAVASHDPALIPEAVAHLSHTEDLPAAAVPLLVKAVELPEASPQMLSQTVASLARTDGDAAVQAMLAALVRLEEMVADRFAREESALAIDDTRNMLEAAAAAFVGSPRLDQRHEQLEQVAASLKPHASRWADAALLQLSTRATASPEAKDAAARALDAGWKESPDRRVQILKAAAAIKYRQWANRILTAADDVDARVRQAAAATAESLKLTQVKDSTPTVESVAPADVLAAVLAVQGDEATGEIVFSKAACVTCHTVRQGEQQKGPYLGNIAKTYKRRELAEAILNPDKTIAQGFVSEVFVMHDGTQHTGYVSLQGADEMKIRNATGQEFTLRATDIDERHKLATSMMPTGLMAKFTTREFASLLDYLESLANGK